MQVNDPHSTDVTSTETIYTVAYLGGGLVRGPPLWPDRRDFYPRRARSAHGVDTVLTLDVCMFVCMLAL